MLVGACFLDARCNPFVFLRWSGCCAVLPCFGMVPCEVCCPKSNVGDTPIRAYRSALLGFNPVHSCRSDVLCRGFWDLLQKKPCTRWTNFGSTMCSRISSRLTPSNLPLINTLHPAAVGLCVTWAHTRWSTRTNRQRPDRRPVHRDRSGHAGHPVPSL